MSIEPKIDPTKVRIGDTKQLEAIFRQDKQTADDLRKFLEMALGKAGCLACGRLHRLVIEFQPDPVDKAIQTAIPSVVAVSQRGF